MVHGWPSRPVQVYNMAHPQKEGNNNRVTIESKIPFTKSLLLEENVERVQKSQQLFNFATA